MSCEVDLPSWTQHGESAVNNTWAALVPLAAMPIKGCIEQLDTRQQTMFDPASGVRKDIVSHLFILLCYSIVIMNIIITVTTIVTTSSVVIGMILQHTVLCNATGHVALGQLHDQLPCRRRWP